MPRKNRPHTPDGRYLVSRGVLKRCTNPMLGDAIRRQALKTLMQARLAKDSVAAFNAKEVLGEAGALWWSDGSDDVSGRTPEETEYAQWWSALTEAQRATGR